MVETHKKNSIKGSEVRESITQTENLDFEINLYNVLLTVTRYMGEKEVVSISDLRECQRLQSLKCHSSCCHAVHYAPLRCVAVHSGELQRPCTEPLVDCGPDNTCLSCRHASPSSECCCRNSGNMLQSTKGENQTYIIKKITELPSYTNKNECRQLRTNFCVLRHSAIISVVASTA